MEVKEKAEQEGEEGNPLISLFASFQDYLSNDQEIREVRFVKFPPLVRPRTYSPNQLPQRTFNFKYTCICWISLSSLGSLVKWKMSIFFSFDSGAILRLPWSCIKLTRRVLSVYAGRPVRDWFGNTQLDPRKIERTFLIKPGQPGGMLVPFFYSFSEFFT